MKETVVRVHKESSGKDSPRVTVNYKWVFQVDWDTMLEWRDCLVRILVRCDGSNRWAAAEAPVRHYGIVLVPVNPDVDKTRFVKQVEGVLKTITRLATCSIVPMPISSDQLFLNLQILITGAFRRRPLLELWPAYKIVDEAVNAHDTQSSDRVRELSHSDGYEGPLWTDVLR